jgi:AcrR family transcriptional regulator
VNGKVVSPTKQKTKDNIIRISKLLFDEFGIENTTIMKIAGECQISRRTIYDHFYSKNEIIFKVLLDYFNELYDIDYTLIKEEELIPKLKKLLHVVFDRYLDNPIIMKFLINYYQLNPTKISDENQYMHEIESVNKIVSFIDLSSLNNGEPKGIQEKIEIILQHILGLGMRYSLRENAFLVFTHNISKKSLHESIDVLMQILDN